MAKRQPLYSLWLMTNKSVGAGEKLARIISELATEWEAPSFLPHITLLGSINLDADDVLARASRLCKKKKGGFSLRCGHVQAEAFIYKSLFLPIGVDLDIGKLAALRQRAVEIFEQDQGSCYQPHISLLYKKLPQETKTRHITPYLEGFTPTFPVTRLGVWRTDGPVRTWKQVTSYKL